MKYIQNWVATRCFYLLCFLACWSAAAFAEGVSATAEADRFLSQLLSAEHRGMGGSFVGGAQGATALGSNPAGINAVAGNRLVIYTSRFPRTIAVLSRPNFDSIYEDYSRYEQRASGIETLNWVLPLGRFGTWGLGFAFAHEGPFRRVDHNGKALNSFPENNLALGMSYGVKLFGGLNIGIDTKWLRSKVSDATGMAHLGHGYAYNIGCTQELGRGFQVGIVLRNLSNGLSFSDASIPRRMQRDIVAGIAYRREVSDSTTVRIGLDVNPPFNDGLRTNLGAEFWYRERIGCRIGYLRDIENRYASVYLQASDALESEERLWKSEGMCYGVGVRFGDVMLNAAYMPVFKPVAATDERISLIQGDAVYTFSIGFFVS